MCVWISFLSVRTITRNFDWSDAIRFYEQTLRYNPNNIKILYNLGNEYLKRGDAPHAINAYKNIEHVVENTTLLTQGKGSDVLLKRLRAKMYNNLGNAYVLEENYEKAFRAYYASIRIVPTHSLTYENMAKLFNRLGDTKRAEECYAKVKWLNTKRI